MVDKSDTSRYVAMASHIYIVNYIGLSLLHTLLITLAYHICEVWQCVRSQISTDIPILKYPTNKGTTSDNEDPFIHTLIHRSQLCFFGSSRATYSQYPWDMNGILMGHHVCSYIPDDKPGSCPNVWKNINSLKLSLEWLCNIV